jgi:hypothetical protein
MWYLMVQEDLNLNLNLLVPFFDAPYLDILREFLVHNCFHIYLHILNKNGIISIINIKLEELHE